MKTTKGKIRILQQGAKYKETIIQRHYGENGIEKEVNEIEHNSTPKIDKERESVLTKVMKKLSKKNINILSIEQDEQYTTINYEVQS